jgi:hypothetical protein
MGWLLIATVVGLLLLFLLAGFAPNPAVRRLAMRRSQEPGQPRPRITSRAFQKLVRDLLARMDFEILEDEGNLDDTRLLLTRRGPPEVGETTFVAHVIAAPIGEVVDQPRLVALLDDVTGEGAARGMLFTPYEIDRSGLAMLEGIDLFDGPRVRQLVARYFPGRLRDLDPYAGVGITVPTPV